MFYEQMMVQVPGKKDNIDEEKCVQAVSITERTSRTDTACIPSVLM